ncbi:hypothetical protein DFH06DRAFT_1126241 [Mycena polygramma]|nr:hypothetical protein DFH06DRAFT_1126241 [Mycena polygramma]
MHLLSALLLCAAGTLASKPQHQPHHPAVPRTHNIAFRLRGPANATSREMGGNGMEMEKRDSYTGVAMTWYPTNTGPDACTGKNHKDRDWKTFTTALRSLFHPCRDPTAGSSPLAVFISLLLLVPRLQRRRHHLAVYSILRILSNPLLPRLILSPSPNLASPPLPHLPS